MLIHIVGLLHTIMVKRHSIIERRQLELFYRANPKNAGVLNHEGFYVVDWAKGVAMSDPYSPYDDDGASLYKAEYKKGTKGPCWDGYTYVGDTPYSKGSCVKNAETFQGEIIYLEDEEEKWDEELARLRRSGRFNVLKTFTDQAPPYGVGAYPHDIIWTSRNRQAIADIQIIEEIVTKKDSNYHYDHTFYWAFIWGFELSKKARNKGKARKLLKECVADLTEWLNEKNQYNPIYHDINKNSIVVQDATEDAIPFWDKMMKEGIITGYAKGDSMERVGVWVNDYINEKYPLLYDDEGDMVAENYESQYTPSQELRDYTLDDLVSSSAIEGYEPLKYSVVGNRAETFYGEITTEPMTVYRRMDWKQYYDGLELGYLHPMRTRMQLRPDENIGGTWGRGQPQIWAARKPDFNSPLKHLKGSKAKQLFEIDVPIGTRIREGYDIQLFDSIPIENVRPFYLGDEGEYTHMAETKPPKTSKGLIVYPNRMAELIRDGDKQMIVKDKPLDIAGKRYTVVTNRKGYAYIQLGAMQTLTLPKFKALKDKHLITPEERVKYFKGKRRLYAWPVKVLREFDKAYPTNAPLRPQDIAPKLKTYASEERNAEKEIVY